MDIKLTKMAQLLAAILILVTMLELQSTTGQSMMGLVRRADEETMCKKDEPCGLTNRWPPRFGKRFNTPIAKFAPPPEALVIENHPAEESNDEQFRRMISSVCKHVNALENY